MVSAVLRHAVGMASYDEQTAEAQGQETGFSPTAAGRIHPTPVHADWTLMLKLWKMPILSAN